MTKRKNVTFDDLKKALEVMAAYHEQRGLTYVAINTESGILAHGGNSLELEALLNQSRLYIEGMNNINFVNIHTARNAAAKAASESKEEVKEAQNVN